jgi:CheY-like chemotaxis protein
MRNAKCLRSDILQGVWVLIVEDEHDAREVLSLVLKLYRADVMAVGSAAEALTAMDEWLPDVLVVDIGLPDEDGYTLMRKVRSLKPQQGGRIPALALTAFSRTRDRQQALSAGFQAHMVKPADPAELVNVVAQLSKAGFVVSGLA